MSKAFTKEDDRDDDDLPESPDQKIPLGRKNYMTPKGAERLRTELHQLLNIDRPKLVETVAWAASNGDRSENGDYIYGKRKLREIDRRIRFLTKRLDAAEVVDPAKQKSEQVLFGATVTVQDEDGQLRVYKIVGIDEADGRTGKISWISPIGRSLLQNRVGDVVNVQTPKGLLELEITKIQYLALEAD